MDRTKTSRGALAQTVEKRIVAQRNQEAAREDIQKYYGEAKAIDALAGNALKDDMKRYARAAQERQAEAQMLNGLYANDKAKELASIKAEEEEKLAAALQKRMNESERHTKEIQQLHEQSSELKELAEKIRIARMNKERALQLKEKAQIKGQQEEYDRTFNAYVNEAEAAANQRDAESQANRRAQNISARHVLEDQMQEKQDAVRLAEQEFLRERALVDEVIRRIQDEDAAEVALRRSKQDETRAYIGHFLDEQERAKAKQRAMLDNEEQQRQNHWENVRNREAEEAARKVARKVEADRMYEQVRREVERRARERDEEELLIGQLYYEELEEKRRQAEEDAKRRQEQLKQEMIRANQQQMYLKEQRDLAFKAEEEAFRAAMMAKFAEDDRIEQLNAQKRRMKMADHTRAVQAMMEDKRRLYEQQKARDEAEHAARVAQEERKLALIEDERRRLLAEAAELREYLPKGVLRDQADVEFVNQQMQRAQVAPPRR